MADLNQRYDIVAIDPRGVDGSTGAIDCKVNQETQGIYRMPFPTPFTANINRIADASRAYGPAASRSTTSTSWPTPRRRRRRTTWT